jgi:nucleotide-binding universal stress UspA family protein
MFRKILAALDGSEGSWRAMRAAINLAREQRAELWALSVEDHLPRFAATVGEMEEEKDFANHAYQRLQQEARILAGEAGVLLHTDIVAGHAAQSIVEYAKQHGFDLIVVGHSGHSGVWANFLGTTTEKISRHAPCSVLIVR